MDLAAALTNINYLAVLTAAASSFIVTFMLIGTIVGGGIDAIAGRWLRLTPGSDRRCWRRLVEFAQWW